MYVYMCELVLRRNFPFFFFFLFRLPMNPYQNMLSLWWVLSFDEFFVALVLEFLWFRYIFIQSQLDFKIDFQLFSYFSLVLFPVIDSDSEMNGSNPTFTNRELLK